MENNSLKNLTDAKRSTSPQRKTLSNLPSSSQEKSNKPSANTMGILERLKMKASESKSKESGSKTVTQPIFKSRDITAQKTITKPLMFKKQSAPEFKSVGTLTANAEVDKDYKSPPRQSSKELPKPKLSKKISRSLIVDEIDHRTKFPTSEFSEKTTRFFVDVNSNLYKLIDENSFEIGRASCRERV